MIKSTKISLKFANTGKLDDLKLFIQEYRRVTIYFIEELWKLEKQTKFLPKDITSKIADTTWLSARAIQCSGKQASGIVRGTKQKQKQRLFMINKFNEQGMFKKARILKEIYDNNTVSAPILEVINPDLDSRFVKIDLDNNTSFDGWITLTCLGDKFKFELPFKKHKHFNKLLRKEGKIKRFISLSNKSATLVFDLPDPIKLSDGNIIGIDIGQTTTITCSDGQSVEADCHGHTYKSICEKLARKKKDSKNFNQAVAHRSNYINWSVNRLNLSNIKQINIENIKYLRKGRSTSRSLGHWNYAELFVKLTSKLEESGVQIKKVSPTYTSQRCSACGWTRSSNRKLKRFKCSQCSFTTDADLNGSINISLNLPAISKTERLLHKNKKGFYWYVISETPIVSHVQKSD